MVDLWVRLALAPEVRESLTAFTRLIGAAFRNKDLQLLLLVPPSVSLFGPSDFRRLAPHVDLFLMDLHVLQPPAIPSDSMPPSDIRELVAALRPGRRASQLVLGIEHSGYR